MKIRSFAALLIVFLLAGLLAGCDRSNALTTVPGTPNPGNQNTIQTGTTKPNDSTTGGVTREQAEEIALNHAGLTREQVRMDRTEPDMDDRVPHYEVEFTANGWEYDYEIHVRTGEILKSEKEWDD